MVTYIIQAIRGLGRFWGGQRRPRISHENLAHAHWDTADRRWYTHEDHDKAA